MEYYQFLEELGLPHEKDIARPALMRIHWKACSPCKLLQALQVKQHPQ
jgi:hypothetical protein